MKVKRLKDVKFGYEPKAMEFDAYAVGAKSYLVIERNSDEDGVILTKREALSFVKFVIKHTSLTSKERLDLHQRIMNEQYTQKRSK